MLLDGKKIAQKLQDEIKEKIFSLQTKPGLAVILVGNNPASLTYVTMKQKYCKEVGIHSVLIKMSEDITEDALLCEIQKLNQDPAIDGILVQLPLPKQIKTENIFTAIDPSKDVDCFHPYNVGLMALGQTDGLLPCTPAGVQQLLLHSHVQISGKHIVIVGRSNLVGKPLALLLMQKGQHANATVTVAHSQTQNLSEICRQADILIVAIGSPQFIKEDMVKEGAIVIDVGIHRVDGKITGDVAFAEVFPKCSLITPVPGGVGPMTITMLLSNCLKAHLLRQSI